MIANEYKKLANVRVVNWENYSTAPLAVPSPTSASAAGAAPQRSLSA